MLVSVVVPVYRAQHSLGELCRRLHAVLQPITAEYEIIFVEDRGGDGSWALIQDLCRQDGRVQGIQLSRNFGQHAATICGLSQARGQWLITLDDDLEQAPEDIPRLLEEARKGYALVYGTYPQRAHSWWRNATSATARRLFRLAIPTLNYEYTSFRVIERGVGHALAQFDGAFPFIDGYLSWITNSYATVEVTHGARQHGRSNYTVRKLITHTVNIFVTFSDLPLKLATYAGVSASLVGLLLFAYIIGARLMGGITVSGFASLMAGIVFFGGLQLLILGIFGEYLGRMNFKSSRKPLYVIGQRTGAP